MKCRRFGHAVEQPHSRPDPRKCFPFQRRDLHVLEPDGSVCRALQTENAPARCRLPRPAVLFGREGGLLPPTKEFPLQDLIRLPGDLPDIVVFVPDRFQKRALTPDIADLTERPRRFFLTRGSGSFIAAIRGSTTRSSPILPRASAAPQRYSGRSWVRLLRNSAIIISRSAALRSAPSSLEPISCRLCRPATKNPRRGKDYHGDHRWI